MIPPPLAPADLEPLADELWHVEQRRHAYGLHLRNRMVVARLETGGLWLHSPVSIEPNVAAQLAALGPVEHIVSPNNFHHMFAAAAAERYPEATLWATPALQRKRADVPWGASLLDDPPWRAELAPVLIAGAPRFDEVAFLHRRSGSLLCCDLLFNVHSEPEWLTRLFFRSLGVWRRFGLSRVFRRSVKDRALASAAAATILEGPITRVVPAHGEVLEDDAAARVAEALAWLTRP
ncbi:MAG: DUF4336 domain-containing protein [Nannocystaceae bacterium]